ncbi:MAG TPA: hypothetical protein VFT22_14630 [Kofleriaceae bacterium]|nr:hypothetical protein [Kofleriaceae bacterium]
MSGSSGRRDCRFTQCDGPCCRDAACWTAYCAPRVCRAFEPRTWTVAPARVTQIAASGDRTCILTDRGTVRCWGEVARCDQPFGRAPGVALGAIGDRPFSSIPRSYPADLPFPRAFTSIAVGAGRACGIDTAGDVHCWGSEEVIGRGSGTLGDPPSAGWRRPAVPLGGKAVRVTVGSTHACALLERGNVRCWGSNDRGQLGYGDRRPRAEAGVGAGADVVLGKRAIRIAAGSRHTCAVTEDHRVMCWGEAKDGELGYGNKSLIGNDEYPATAGEVPVGAPVDDVVTGWQHTCALLVGGRVRCWGSGASGQLGYGYTNTIGDDEPASAAGDVPLGGTAIALAAGGYHTCALLDTGAVRCWGNDGSGQLGYGKHDGFAYENIGAKRPASAAGDVPLGGRAVAITAGGFHTCALLDTGAVRCWGKAGTGQLGYPERPDRPLWQDNVGDDETPADRGDVPFAPEAAHD